ncbi:MAG: UDP-3-O-[3-hydroxymyristoyl] glucosamine N-acyltransferase [Bacteroidia bacterium]
MRLDQPISVEVIANQLGREYRGDGFVKGISEIHCISEGDLSFADHPKYIKMALASEASVLILNEWPNDQNGKSVILSDDPFADFVKLIRHFRPFEASLESVSQSSIVGKNTVISNGVTVGNNVVIGDSCTIHPCVTIYDHSIIGDNVIIHAGSVIGSDAFYFNRKLEGYRKLYSCGRVIIGNNVEIGAGCTIDRGSTDDTVIGSGTKMDNQVHVGHDTVIGQNCLFAAQVGIAGVVTIEDDVILWGQVGVQKDLTIGKGAVVLGQSGIGKDLLPNTTYFGSPVREARTKMKELAQIKRLPEMIQYLNNAG